jgi:malate dehydrogenase (oxaloacetate-decarboxylating)(NADP+)
MEEFVMAVQEVWPKALLQFEDFGNANAFRLLEHWRDRVCTFNDDIQGTAGVTLAGILTSLRVTKKPLKEQRILFLGAGEAGIGIGDLIASAMVDEGMTLQAARRNCWFFDSKGLVVEGRAGLAEHKLRYAHPHKEVRDFLAAIKELKPTAIVGVSTMPKTFNQAVIEEMSRLNEYPIIFSLSNPTSKSECTAGEAYTWSKGKALYASGSPFPPFEYEGKTYVPGQGNNSYIFPGVGLGVVASEASRVTDRMFSAAARALDNMVLPSDLAMGRVYPSLKRIREISAVIGAAVAEIAHADGLARAPKPANLLQHVKSVMWEPKYETYLK